jgi:hypothetical protein
MRAGFLTRSLLSIGDYLFFAVVILVIDAAIIFSVPELRSAVLAAVRTGEQIQNAQQVTAQHRGLILANILAYFTYWGCEIIWGASVSKMLFGYSIRNVDSTPAERIQLIRRFLFKHAAYIVWYVFMPLLSYYVLSGSAQQMSSLVMVGLFSLGLHLSSLAFMLVYVVGCFFVLGYERQAFHDRFADTAVYNYRYFNSPSQFVPAQAMPLTPKRRSTFDANSQLITQKKDFPESPN